MKSSKKNFTFILLRITTQLLRLMKNKVIRERGLSYQSIADTFNLWKVATRTGQVKLYGKTVKELLD
jgi:hypothetical protein